MKTLKLTLIAALAAVLVGCGTTRINTQAMDAYGMAMQHQRALADQHAGGCASAASMCAHDTNPGLCVVAAQLACNAGRPAQAVQMPQLRSPGEEFARGFAPIASLASTGLQVWGAGWLVDRSGRNAVDLVGAVGGVVGQVQGPIDNSVTVGGNLGDTRGHEVGGNFGDTRGDEWIAGGNIGDTRGDEFNAGRDIRIGSPGPIDNSDNSTGPVDNSINTPEPTPPEP